MVAKGRIRDRKWLRLVTCGWRLVASIPSAWLASQAKNRLRRRVLPWGFPWGDTDCARWSPVWRVSREGIWRFLRYRPARTAPRRPNRSPFVLRTRGSRSSGRCPSCISSWSQDSHVAVGSHNSFNGHGSTLETRPFRKRAVRRGASCRMSSDRNRAMCVKVDPKPMAPRSLHDQKKIEGGV